MAIAYESGPEGVIEANGVERKLKSKYKDELKLNHFRDAIRSTRALLKRAVLSTVKVPTDAPDLLRQPLNDQGNAERVRALYGEDLRYCPSFRKWLVWDGRRWIVDDFGRARQFAKEAMRIFAKQSSFGDEEVMKSAIHSLNEKPLTAMLRMLESDLPVSPTDLDRNPWALNCLNGTVELKTATIRPHDRNDHITKLVHFEYDPTAECNLWKGFLFSAMGDNLDAEPTERAARLVAYIQRALGYSITGSTSEKAVFIPLGEHGNNGKSTMLDTVRRIIREYSALLQVDTLMVRQESNNTQADLADLRGARFVQTSETEESQSLSQGKLKMLTAGMGTIKACRKFENPIEFEANFHIWLDTNKMPYIRDPDDTATLSRLHPIPFNVRIPDDKIDREMPDKLFAEAPGILAWMVHGAREWHSSRLNRPVEIVRAREDWKSSQEDPWCEAVEKWLEDKHKEFAPPTSLEKKQYFTASTAAILEGALAVRIKDMGQHRGDAIRLGRILKRINWISDGQTGVSKIRVYRKGPQ